MFTWPASSLHANVIRLGVSHYVGALYVGGQARGLKIFTSYETQARISELSHPVSNLPRYV